MECQWRRADLPAGIEPYANPEKFQVSQMMISEFQDLMLRTYGERDRERGVAVAVAWLVEEVGELAQAIRKGDDEARRHELADVLAWLASIAAQLDLSLEDAVARYAEGCPRCGSLPCQC